MATALDFAAYFRALPQYSGGMQLQKLLYYSQVWSLVWSGTPVIDDEFEAWKDGPVVRGVWVHYRYTAPADWCGDAHALSPKEKAIADAIATFYGKMSGGALRDLTHEEAPWCDAFAIARNTTITPVAMVRYYSKLASEGGNAPDRPNLDDAYVSDQRFREVATSQISRWQETLDLLAQ